MLSDTSSRYPLSLLFGALALALPACDPDESPVEDLAAADEIAAAAVELPEVTADDIAAALAERRIASLPVAGAGRIDIVDIAATGAPNYAYFTVGGQAATDALQQLVDDQRATPAEVFLALAEDELPDALLADHRARAEEDPELSGEPRRLNFVAPRTFDTDINGCPGSLGAWVGSWATRFEGGYFTDGFQTTGKNTSNPGTTYYVAADSGGRVMSACNSSTNEVMVVYWALTFQPGLYYPYTLLWGNELGTIEATHMFSKGSGPVFGMSVSHPSPDPETYFAYGRCGGGCWK